MNTGVGVQGYHLEISAGIPVYISTVRFLLGPFMGSQVKQKYKQEDEVAHPWTTGVTCQTSCHVPMCMCAVGKLFCFPPDITVLVDWA